MFASSQCNAFAAFPDFCVDDVDDFNVRVMDFRPLQPPPQLALPPPCAQDAGEADDAFCGIELIFDLEL